LQIEDGSLRVAEGSLPEANLVIEAGPAIKTLMAREVNPAEAIANGLVHLTGDTDLLGRFVEIFQI